jgi:protein-S-isoprenylcysteine O-methyltransferase Ste14
MAIGIVIAFGGGAAYWVAANPVVDKSLFLMGIALAGFGAAGRAWAVSYISGRKQKQLVRTGPYSLCRNPLYFFSLLLGVGFGLCTRTVSVPIIIAVAMALLYYFQIRREEAQLSAIFGYEFDAYVATVPRFFPSHRHYSEPEEITISPRLLKHGLFGIAFLLILIGAFEFISGLHQGGILPVFYRIY